MASLREIRRKIQSVKSTQQITRAMKMVATAKLRKAVERLDRPFDIVLADGNSFRHETWRYRNIIDGDAKSVTIAAASVIAKVTRDRLMREYHEKFPQYGFDRHKGYGTKFHLQALREHGMCPIHRRSFRMPVPAIDSTP